MYIARSTTIGWLFVTSITADTSVAASSFCGCGRFRSPTSNVSSSTQIVRRLARGTV